MEDFVLCRGDTKMVNYILKDINIVFCDVIFYYKINGVKRNIKCIPQSIESPDYTNWSMGGVAIPFEKIDINDSGVGEAQFKIIDQNGYQSTYPQNGFLSMRVQRSI
jgi:hypothetical protein